MMRKSPDQSKFPFNTCCLGVVLFLAGPAFSSTATFEYGDDSSEYANDGVCDDLRFVGPGMKDVILTADETLRDASDCRQMVERGLIRYGGDDPLDFGTDSGDYARDGECDDPRFEGPGMTTTVLLAEDIKTDASDCREAFEKGHIRLR